MAFAPSCRSVTVTIPARTGLAVTASPAAAPIPAASRVRCPARAGGVRLWQRWERRSAGTVRGGALPGSVRCGRSGACRGRSGPPLMRGGRFRRWAGRPRRPPPRTRPSPRWRRVSRDPARRAGASEGLESPAEAFKREGGKAQCIEDAGQDRGEPDDPPHHEGDLDREKLPGVDIQAARIGEMPGQPCETRGGQERDGAVQSEGDDGARSGTPASARIPPPTIAPTPRAVAPKRRGVAGGPSRGVRGRGVPKTGRRGPRVVPPCVGLHGTRGLGSRPRGGVAVTVRTPPALCASWFPHADAPVLPCTRILSHRKRRIPLPLRSDR